MKHSATNSSDPLIQEAGLRLFQDSIDPVIITDLQGTIVVANEQAVNLFKYQPEEIIGIEISVLHQQGDNLPDFTKLPDNSIKHFDSVVLSSTQGEKLYVAVHARRFTVNGQSIVQWIHHDITRQVKLDQLRQNQAAMLVHDLQSPLGNVISSLELIRGELNTESSATLHSMVDIAVRSSHFLQELVSSLLDISRLEAGHPIRDLKPVDIRSVIEFVSSVQEPDFEQRNITLQLEIDADVHNVLADSNILRRILLNLLNNALKYSQTGQSIIVAACNVDDDNLVQLAVIDSGQGVPEQYHDVIFEKFQRADVNSPAAGLGLGLAFCRLAVEALGGHIWVENSPAGGACFYFTIPAAENNG